MKLTLEEKLKMCKEHVIDKKTLSHVSERHRNYNLSEIKYLINLYRRHGEKPFISGENGNYKRGTKLISISRVKKGESIRSVSKVVNFLKYIDLTPIGVL